MMMGCSSESRTNWLPMYQLCACGVSLKMDSDKRRKIVSNIRTMQACMHLQACRRFYSRPLCRDRLVVAVVQARVVVVEEDEIMGPSTISRAASRISRIEAFWP